MSMFVLELTMLDSAAKEQMEQTLYRKSSNKSLAEGLLKDNGSKRVAAGPGPRGLAGYPSEKPRNGFASDPSSDRVPSGKLLIRDQVFLKSVTMCAFCSL